MVLENVVMVLQVSPDHANSLGGKIYLMMPIVNNKILGKVNKLFKVDSNHNFDLA